MRHLASMSWTTTCDKEQRWSWPSTVTRQRHRPRWKENSYKSQICRHRWWKYSHGDHPPFSGCTQVCHLDNLVSHRRLQPTSLAFCTGRRRVGSLFFFIRVLRWHVAIKTWNRHLFVYLKMFYSKAYDIWTHYVFFSSWNMNEVTRALLFCGHTLLIYSSCIYPCSSGLLHWY